MADQMGGKSRVWKVLRFRPAQAIVAALVVVGALAGALTANTTTATNGPKSLAASCGYAGAPCPPTTAPHGFWLLGRDGGVFTFGQAPYEGSGRASPAPAIAVVSSRDGGGYWVVDSDGLIRAFGDAPVLHLTGMAGHSSLNGVRLAAPIVGAAPTPDGGGLWLVGGDGGTFTFGDAQPQQLSGAPGHVSLAGFHLDAPVTAIAASPFGNGFWVLGGDGGVFTFGHAPFEGSGKASSATAVAIVSTLSGDGYWVIGADGLIGPHNAPTLALTGDPGHSSLAGIRLAAPVVAAADTADGGGLWETAGDGGVFTYGDAPTLQLAGAPGHTSLADFNLAAPISSIARGNI